MTIGRTLSLIVLLLHSLSSITDAFTPVTNSLARHSTSPPNAVLSAKRRRRKDAPSSQSTTDELPDFDIAEIENEASEEATSETKIEKPKLKPPAPPALSKPANPTPIKRGSGLNPQLAEDLGGNVDGLDEDLILTAMRGKGESWMPPRSIQDTLNDRSLERFMDFDAMIRQDGGGGKKVELPTMEEVVARRKQREAADAVQEGRIEDAAMLIDTEGMGKKAAKKAERKAAAMQREALEAGKANEFNLEDLNVLKLLENGAWVGIGLLVVWEVYINSPLFERAAPLIPVVYDQVPGM